jgi:hypothetical protein
VCQSIELSLKAFLRGSGYSDKQLRQLGHNLDECVTAAKAAGIEIYVTFSEVDLSSIASINKYYQAKDLQYSTTGFKSYPSQDWLLRLADRLWKSLRPFCVEHREYHFGKPTAIT